MIMTEEYKMYSQIRQLFIDQVSTGIFYDVDMFCTDICNYLFTETDPQDIDEDGYLTLQEALILLVRDDLLLDWFTLSGLCVLHAELMDKGEAYYINKVIFKEA